MTAIFTEQQESRLETIEDDSPQAERVAVVTGATTEEEVKASALVGFPLYHGALKRKSISLDERMTPTSWRVKAKYERAELTSSPSFDISSTTVHVENSTRTLIAVGPEADEGRVGESNPIDFDGTTIRGADILVPVFTLSVTQTLAKNVVTQSFMDLVASLTGCTNSKTFLGYSAGDVLFQGAAATRRETLEWEVNFKFAIKRAVAAERIGSIDVPERPGWSYRWVVYGDKKEWILGPFVDGQQPFRIVRRAVAVYVEQIYPEGDLNLLGVEAFE